MSCGVGDGGSYQKTLTDWFLSSVYRKLQEISYFFGQVNCTYSRHLFCAVMHR
jgi:hypothetical protein